MRSPLESAGIAHEKFATPDVAIEAVAGAIPDDADDGLIQLVLGQHGSQVGMMVLNPDQRQSHVLGKARRVIVGVQSHATTRGRTSKRSSYRRNVAGVMFQRLQVLHVANVLADKGILIAGERERRFEFRPDRQRWVA